MSSFIDMCRIGEVKPEDIDDFIDAWHDGPGLLSLHNFLGMTHAEYGSWINDAMTLPGIIAGIPITTPMLHHLKVPARDS